MKITYSYYGKLANIVSLKESEKLKNGYLCFYRNNLADFPYQFTALEKGDFMFMNTGYHKMPSDDKCEEFKVVLSEKDYLAQKNLKEEETGTPPSSSEEAKDYLITADCFPVLTSGYYMFAYSYGLNTIQQNFPKLENGERMFYYTKALAYFDYIASEEPVVHDELNFHDQTEVPASGYYMYATTGFEYLNMAYEMFAHSYLTSFYRDLPKLENANYMFSYATKLTYLNFADEFGKFDYENRYYSISTNPSPPEGEPKGYEYPYIKTANYMFQATNVTHFYRHLPKVEECVGMFAGSKLTYLQCGSGYSFLGSESSDIKPNCKDIFKTEENAEKRDLYIGSRPWAATPDSLETMFKDCTIHNWVSNWCYIDGTTDKSFSDSIYDDKELAKRYIGGYTLTAHKIDEWTLYRILYHIGGMIKLSGSTGGTIHLNVAEDVIKKYKNICSAHPDSTREGYSVASAAYYVTAMLKWGFPNHTFDGNVIKTDTSLLRVHEEVLGWDDSGWFPWGLPVSTTSTSTFDLANEEPPTTSIVSEETTTQMWGLN